MIDRSLLPQRQQPDADTFHVNFQAALNMDPDALMACEYVGSSGRPAEDFGIFDRNQDGIVSLDDQLASP